MTRTWLEISPARIKHNLSVIKGMMAEQVSLIGVVKANAYGHGAKPFARMLYREGIERFAVASLDEALELRQVLPFPTEIFVFGGVEENRLEEYRKENLTASLYEKRSLPPGIKFHVKIDTGMGRLGFDWQEFRRVFNSPLPGMTGVFSHFSSADEDPEFTMEQLRRFRTATEGFPGLTKHIANSAGLRFPRAHLDAVRPGLALYGIAPCEGFEALLPVARWKARILSVRTFSAGSPVGYGRTYVTTRRSRIGILPVGYADGYNRLLSGKGRVGLVSGELVPVVGIISMDLTALDLTGHPKVRAGDEVTLLDADPASGISAQAIAGMTGTIPYEVMTSIGSRVTRSYVDFQ